MNLWFHCPGCNLQMHIGDEFAGHLVACPDCSTRFIVPATAAPEFAEAVDEPEEQSAEAESSAQAPPAPGVPYFQTLDEASPADRIDSRAPGRRRSGRSSPPAQETRDAYTGQPPVTLPQDHFTGPAEFDADEFTPEVREPSLSRPSAKIDPEELIDMTAMVDIVFFLLIFFLVTSMHPLDSSIAMPVPDPQQGAGAAAEPSTLEEFETNDDYIVVHIERNNLIEIDGVPLRDVQDLVVKLRELHAAAPHPNKLLVVGDGEASHGTMVAVLDAGHDAGLERVRMAISGQNEEE